MEIIREERPGDAPGIHGVHVASFPAADEAELVDELRDAGHLLHSFVADADGRIVGHVAFSPVTLAGTGGGVGLAPLAVVPDCRERGVGARLAKAGLAACRDAGHGFVVLLGSPHYYPRFGFGPASARDLVDEYAGGDAFQVIELRTGALPAAGGVVRYGPEFAKWIE